jgi:Taurine catabolism dioxygenase TauD, TfdA family
VPADGTRGEVPEGERPYFTIPVFNAHAGELSAIYQRQYIDSAQRFADAPRLTPAHIEALDLFDQLANDPSLHFLMTLQRGDMQLVHNHTLLHDRTAFSDAPEPARRRHLLRLWLAPDDARALPPVFAQRYGSVVPGRRGGVPARDRCAPLDVAPAVGDVGSIASNP